MTKPLSRTITQKEIESQESRLAEISNQISGIEKEMRDLQDQHDVITTIISALHSRLPQNSSSIKLSVTATGIRLATKSSTLRILVDSKTKRGMEVKDIEAEYDSRGVTTTGRVIFRHIEALMQEGVVEQVNPEAKRYRRYIAVRNTESEPSLLPVNSESE